MNGSIVLRVAQAELRKAMNVSGIRRWVIASVVLGSLVGLGLVWMARKPTASLYQTLTATQAAEASFLVVLILFMMATSNYVTRDISEGVYAGAKILVPSTPSLFAGRVLSWFGLSFVVGLTATVVPYVAASMTSGFKEQSLGGSMASLLLMCLSVAIASVLIYLCAVVVKKGAFVVGVAILMIFVLPLLMSKMAAYLLPVWAQDLTQSLSQWLVGTLVVHASDLPGFSDGATWLGLVQVWTGLSLWIAAALAAGYWAFSRESYGAE